MQIESLAINNFRNYDEAFLSFHPHTNILYGDNAQGKTNILEALYVGGTTKSHRGNKDKDMIQIDKNEAHIRIMLQKKGTSRKIDMHLKKNKAKGIAIDGIPIRRSAELMGLLNIIFFSPEDLKLIKSGPSIRRNFLNVELCQLDPLYLHHLIEYNKVIVQRNKLLKQLNFNPDLKDTLFIWDEQLIASGMEIIKRREQFVKEIAPIVENIHKKLTGCGEKLEIIYEKNVLAENFKEKLNQSLNNDLRLLSTTIGPHHDDLSFKINGIDLKKYGSQGQQRTCALSLKLAEIEIVKQITHDTPILLLDDVLSELDRNRQNYLLDCIHDIQTVITCTGLEEFIQSRITLDKVFRIINGTVVCEKGK